MISILGDWTYHFPKPFELKTFLKDVLEENVDEKYYLSEKMIDCFTSDTKMGTMTRKDRFIQNLNRPNPEIANSITTCAGSRVTDNFIVDENVNQNKIIKVGKTKSGGERSEIISDQGICSSLTATDYKQPKQILLSGNKSLNKTIANNDIEENAFIDTYNNKVRNDGIAGTITTGVDFRNRTFIAVKDSILVPEASKKGYQEAHAGDGVYLDRPYQKRGVVQKGKIPTLKANGDDVGVVVKVPLKRGYSVEVKEESKDATGIDVIGNYSKSNFNQTPIVNKNGIAPTVTENHGQITAVVEDEIEEISNLRIRKLTPKECGRLMGVRDEDIDKMSKNQSNSSLYHLFGDSIVVDVMYYMFRQLF